MLRALNKEDLLFFSSEEKSWKWQYSAIKAEKFSDNIVDLMVRKLKALPIDSQIFITLAASFGSQFELFIIRVILNRPEAEVQKQLRLLLEEKLLIPFDGYYKFAHDRIQQASYLLTPEEKKGEKHCQIGNALLNNLSKDEVEIYLFDIVNQLNAANALLENIALSRIELANLNLRAGRKAKNKAAFGSAENFFKAGMDLLIEGDWENHFELTSALFPKPQKRNI